MTNIVHTQKEFVVYERPIAVQVVVLFILDTLHNYVSPTRDRYALNCLIRIN